jgi:hypothetical protein
VHKLVHTRVFGSVLDACAAMMPQRQLKWHNRSEHESLIAFRIALFTITAWLYFLLGYRRTRGLASNLNMFQMGFTSEGGGEITFAKLRGS